MWKPKWTLLSAFLALALVLSGTACRQLLLQHIKPLEILGFKTVLMADTVWSKADSPHQVLENVFILPEVTLCIEPGAEVLLAPGVQIKSQGRIIAVGTEAAPIRIGPLQDAPWDRIECFGGWFLEDGSLPVNEFRHCRIQGGRGITIRSAAVHMQDCIMHDNLSTALRIEFGAGKVVSNRIHDNSTRQETASGNGAGIMVYTDKSVLIEDNQIYGNQSWGGRDGGGGIYAFAYDTGQIAVKGNRVEKNRSDRHGGGLVVYACRVEDNEIADNQAADNGGGIYAIRSVLKNNRIRQNRAACGGGIFADNARIQGNAVTCNQAAPEKGSGLFYFGEGRIEANSFVRNAPATGAGGETIIVSGNPTLARNNIIAESGYALRVHTHQLAVDLNAQGNYWGSIEPAVIDSLIYDWLKDSSVGLTDRQAPAPAWISGTPPPPQDAAATVTRLLPEPQAGSLSGAVLSSQVIGSSTAAIVNINGNLLIAEGADLKILPGTTINLSPGATIRTRGRLLAEGEPSRPIRFTTSAESPWGQLLFEKKSLAGLAKAAEEEQEESPADQSGVLRHCLVEKGLGIVMEETGPRIENCRIQNNLGSGITIRNAGVTIAGNTIVKNQSPGNGGGIYAYGSRPIHIRNNAIADNRAAEDGGGVFAYGYRSNTAVNLAGNLIENNHCGNDGGGLWASRAGVLSNRIQHNQARGNGGGVFATFALVEKNEIDYNQAEQGGGVFAEANSSLTGNRISGNNIKGKYGGAVYLNFWGVSIKNETFSHNQVSANHSQDQTGVGGIYLNGVMIFDYNDIYDNSGFQLQNGNPAGQPALEAVQCYWGDQGQADKDALIFDGKDDPALAMVRYQPCRTQPLETD